MKKTLLTIGFEIYETASELAENEQKLLILAKTALENAYAPYSKFHVGAAILLSNGAIVCGTNIENASYPLCLCAEPSALAAAKSQWPDAQPTTMAIAVKNFQMGENGRKIINQPGTPCGACRQILCEAETRNGQPIRLILQGETGEIWAFASARDLLPLGFGAEFL